MTRPDVIVGSAGQRFVLVHYHIFKNGGSTIEAILEREFPGRFAALHGPHASSTLDRRELERFLRRNPKLTAISSHHLRYPKPAIRNTVIFDCCFLRHPLERLDSLYRYLRGVPGDDYLASRARGMTPCEFFRELIDEAPHLISNVQVTQIACAGAFARPAHHGDLERAAAILGDMAVPGVVERFEQSLAAAEYFLQPAFPDISLEFVPQNVSGGHATCSEERLTRFWGAEIYDDLYRLNRLDLELFALADEEIRRRFALIPQAERRLLDLRSRCARLRGELPPAFAVGAP